MSDDKFKLAASLLNDKASKPKMDMKQQLTAFGLYKQATEERTRSLPQRRVTWLRTTSGLRGASAGT